MSKIQSAFSNGKAFIPFITCGDPDLETTGKVIREAVKNGADLIELGIPFSDPTAEGKERIEANMRALSSGVTTDKIFDFVKELRKDVEIPLIFTTYANVVFYYGAETFLETCGKIGVDGIRFLDLPFEERGEFDAFCKHYGVALILQAAPASNQRLSMIAKEAEGFLYMTADLKANKTEEEMPAEISHMVRTIRENTDIPCVIDFSFSTAKQVQKAAAFVDGIIAGSAIVEMIKQNGKDSAEPVGEYVRSIKEIIVHKYTT